MNIYLYKLDNKKKDVNKKMSLFNLFKPEISKRKMEELKEKLELNRNYIQEKEAYKLKRELKAYV